MPGDIKSAGMSNPKSKEGFENGVQVRGFAFLLKNIGLP